MDDSQLVAVLNSLQTSLSNHIADNQRRFYDIDATLSGIQEDLSFKEKGTIMADSTTDNVKIHNHAPGADPMAAMMMAASRGGNDGLFGAGGGGIIGGLLLGSLLRNGGLFGGGADGAVTAQPQANMSIMSTLGDIKQAVAVGTAQMETSQALQSSTIQSQLSSVAAATVAQIGGVKDAVNSNTVALMQMINGVTQAISNDGDKTRAILVSQNEATLNRQLTTAQAEVIELRNDLRNDQRARTTEVNVTQQVNQQQQQAQQQQQFNHLQSLLLDAVQSIRATNQAINIGGSQTANPTNTNTNVRA